jgi:thymidylate synthase (FAD)
MSLAVESTRYCNYSKNKFGKALTFIIPDWCTYIDEGESYFHDGICFRTGASESNYYFGTKSWTKPKENENQDSWNKQLGFIKYMNFVETTYLKLISIGMKPDQVRGILPLDTKCDMIMTGFVSDWKHFFDLRALGTTGAPHPQAKELAEPLMEEFKKLNLL